MQKYNSSVTGNLNSVVPFCSKTAVWWIKPGNKNHIYETRNTLFFHKIQHTQRRCVHSKEDEDADELLVFLFFV